jgi:hypothetical protein
MNSSIYIPRISASYDEDYIKAAFKNLDIGSVTRVDFAPNNTGFFRKAFIHVDKYFDSMIANDIRNAHMDEQSYNLYPDFINQSVYWILLKNHKPVQETTLNIHQVVENHRILEEIVMKHEEIVMKHEEIVMKHEEQIKSLHQIIYHLVKAHEIAIFNSGLLNIPNDGSNKKQN